MKRPTLSVTICAKNEEALIERTLECVRTLADEVIVVDNGSTDRTAAKAEAAGARVLSYPKDKLQAWNVAQEAATSDWVLNLDADEVIEGPDLPEVRRLIRVKDRNVYALRARNYTTTMDLAYRWYPNDGKYPKSEAFSGCPGYWVSYPLRLFRNHPDLKFRVGTSAHQTALPSVQKLGWEIYRSEVTVHNLGVVKGGDRYLAEKNAAYLEGELRQTNRMPTDEVNIARTYFFLGNDAAALQHLETALKREPDLLDAYYIQGLVLKESGKLEEAEESLLQVVAREQNYPDAWAVLGMVYQEMARPEEARGALLTALSLHPTHVLAHNSLAVTLEDLGLPDEAEACYRKVLELHPSLPCALENLSAFYLEQEREEEATLIQQRLQDL